MSCSCVCFLVAGDEHDAQGHHCDYYDERTVQECGILAAFSVTEYISVVGSSVSVSGGKVTSEMCSFKMYSATLTDLCHGEAMRHAGRNVRLWLEH